MSNGYGKSKYGSDASLKKTGKPSKGPGNNFIRVMPAMKSLADEGRWAVYYTTHWGYAGVSTRDAGKTVVRPFRCIEDKDRRSGMIRQRCPECENFNARDEAAKAHEAALKAERVGGKPKYTEDDIDALMKPERDWLQQHSPERKWYINVMYKDGTFGAYKINHKTHKRGIDAKIQELWDNDQIDATDLSQGVWFNIKRLGDGFTVPDVVEVEMETREVNLDGKMVKVQRVLLAPLTEEQAEKGLKECPDLAEQGGAVLSEDQIQALVDSDGDPDAVDEIFGPRRESRPAPARASSKAPALRAKQEDPEEEESTVGEAVQKVGEALEKFTKTLKQDEVVAAIQKSGATVVEVQDDDEAEALARYEAILEKKRKAKEEADAKAVAEAAAKAEAEKATKAEGKKAYAIDDDDFVKKFGAKLAAKKAAAAQG